MESTMYTVGGKSFELRHYGVKGMKLGVRRKCAPDRLDYPNKSSKTTKRVIDDYNSMSEKEFLRKYQTTKKTYAKRVAKYGDPYMNSPLAKMGKKLEAKQKAKTEAKAKTTGKQRMSKGAKAVAGTLAKIGEAFVVDQIFFNGIGTHACAEAIKVVGRATITGYTMARGGYDIEWYDKAGNRVG